ncbi:hypothetical protein WJX74_000191 [Apatococcus lobatus]|uniref:Secreted protein n=1 Tax=Apatococcus lobatus TaxID=904363 RepID=A0AAW1QH60_9CHLO
MAAGEALRSCFAYTWLRGGTKLFGLSGQAHAVVRSACPWLYQRTQTLSAPDCRHEISIPSPTKDHPRHQGSLTSRSKPRRVVAGAWLCCHRSLRRHRFVNAKEAQALRGCNNT